jgi:hypothetical protein
MAVDESVGVSLPHGISVREGHVRNVYATPCGNVA